MFMVAFFWVHGFVHARGKASKGAHPRMQSVSVCSTCLDPFAFHYLFAFLLLPLFRFVAWILLGFYWDSIGILLGFYWDSIPDDHLTKSSGQPSISTHELIIVYTGTMMID